MTKVSPFLRPFVTIVAFVTIVDLAFAHQDPLGDVHPIVVVESGGFSVYFRSNLPSNGSAEPRRPKFRSRYSKNGDLIVARQRIDRFPEIVPAVSVQRYHDPQPPAVIWKAEGEKTVALRWGDTRAGLVESSAISPTHIAVAVQKEENEEDFFVYLFSRTGFRKPEVFYVGQPEAIYNFPVASNLIFAKGKFWMAWVRGTEMVLSSFTPGSGRTKEKVLDTPGYWNSNISIASIEDRLCLAYHISKNFQYPGESKIITKFFTLE